MTTGVWIFLGLVVVALAILKGKGGGASGGSKAAEDSPVMKRFKEKDALVPQLVQECVRAARALPVVDPRTSPLFHDPVYDARSDQFDPPCKDGDFESSAGRCWKTADQIADVFGRYADAEASFKLQLSSPRVGCIVAADDHLDILHCDSSVNEPGLHVMRVSRVAEDRWHVYGYQCGMKQGPSGFAAGNLKIQIATSDADAMDPPLKAVDVARDPTLWTRRTEQVRRRWPQNDNWRYAAKLCTHRQTT